MAVEICHIWISDYNEFVNIWNATSWLASGVSPWKSWSTHLEPDLVSSVRVCVGAQLHLIAKVTRSVEADLHAAATHVDLLPGWRFWRKWDIHLPEAVSKVRLFTRKLALKIPCKFLAKTGDDLRVNETNTQKTRLYMQVVWETDCPVFFYLWIFIQILARWARVLKKSGESVSLC